MRFRNWLLMIVTAIAGVFGQDAAADSALLKQFFQTVQTGAASEVAQMLAQQPYLATQKDRYGFSAIHMLDYIAFDKKLTLLTGYGADINAINDQGHSVLHMVIDPEFIEPIVRAGADVNLADKAGRTPLMTSLQEPHGLDFVPAFIAAGADLNLRDHTGASVLEFAAAFEDDELTEMLKKAGAKP